MHIVEMEDGFYWCDVNNDEYVGPFTSRVEAAANMWDGFEFDDSDYYDYADDRDNYDSYDNYYEDDLFY